MGLQGVIRGYRGLHGITQRYFELQRGYRRLQGNTSGYMGLHAVTGGYRGL